ncbi:Rha family transcriptional regulator [Vagococcus lutrae]|uniref:Rha family transcriptional regulator n=1 Tax=Vagococcus lutrae TaxID=81947 RepID=UPI00288D18DE|nr:Rha family transcriptional regulator [Vagococcus lutrae]MDT2801907.1 Rha family transcriptional regulator [Vagococcus lutrae]
MKELVVIENEQVVTTSLQVAEVFNKQHKHVLEAIDDLIGVVENSADLFYEDTYIHPQNKQEYRQILMNKKGWILIAMGFTGKKATQFKLDYINAFDEMEKMLKDSQPKLPTDPMEILQLTFDAQKQTNERVEVLEEDVKEIKEKQLISTEDKNSLDRMIRRKVAIICKEQHLEQKAKSLLFSDIGKSIKELFGVPHRGRIKDKDFQAAVDFVNTWEPSSLTKTRIKQLRLEL